MRTAEPRQRGNTESPKVGITRLFIGVPEVAEILGMPISTLQKLCAKGPEAGQMPTPVYKFGRRWAWKPSDVEAWAETRRVA